MKLDKSKKSERSQTEKQKDVSTKKPTRVRTAEGWKNYLKKTYLSKK